MHFKLIFDGEALKNHDIYPRDLSSAILAIDDLLKESNNLLNKGRARADVKVTASFETGCFQINFVLSILDQLKDLFTSHGIDALLNAKDILELIFSGSVSVVALIKFLKGRKAEKIYENEDGTLTINKDQKQLIVEKKVYELYNDYKLRKAFQDLVKPVAEREGVEEVAVQYGKEKSDFTVISTKKEASYFICPAPEEEKIDGSVTFETSINVISLSFREGNKWYVNDGQSSFYALVEDEYFLQEVESSHIAFSKGDILRVRIRREQYYIKAESKLKTENFIEKVVKHQKPPSQESFELS